MLEYFKIKKILNKHNIKKPEQLEKSLSELECLRIDKLREHARKQGLKCLEVMNKQETKREEYIPFIDDDPFGILY